MYFADAEVSSKLDWLKLNFEPFVFIPSSEHAESCSVESIDGKIVTTMKLKDVPEMNSLEVVALEIHEIVLGRLTLHYGCSYSDTEVSVTKRKKISEDGTVISCQVGYATCSGGRATVSQGISDISFLQSMFELSLTDKDRWAGILHHVQESGDPIVEFIRCYHILASHHNDKQWKIDKFIRANEPTVRIEARKRLDDNGKIVPLKETIYTRLRNELMHVLDFSSPRDPREIYAEVREYRPGLVQLAKRLVSQLN